MQPVTDLVGVPVVRRGVNALSLVAFQQLLAVPDTHRAADYLPNVGHQHINLQHTRLQLTCVQQGTQKQPKLNTF